MKYRGPVLLINTLMGWGFYWIKGEAEIRAILSRLITDDLKAVYEVDLIDQVDKVYRDDDIRKF